MVSPLWMLLLSKKVLPLFAVDIKHSRNVNAFTFCVSMFFHVSRDDERSACAFRRWTYIIRVVVVVVCIQFFLFSSYDPSQRIDRTMTSFSMFLIKVQNIIFVLKCNTVEFLYCWTGIWNVIKCNPFDILYLYSHSFLIIHFAYIIIWPFTTQDFLLLVIYYFQCAVDLIRLWRLQLNKICGLKNYLTFLYNSFALP